MAASKRFSHIEDSSALALVAFEQGRIFRQSRTLGLADCGSDGHLRFDAAARIAQDIAGADLQDSGLEGEGVWVVRRTHIRFFGAPRYQDVLDVSTFCAGTGRSWAQRRTSLVGPAAKVEVSSLWVQTDPATRAPSSLSERFFEVFGPSARARRVTSRLALAPLDGATSKTLAWPGRVTDIDILGHMNNAAYFEAIEEVATNYDNLSKRRAHAFAVAEYRDGVEAQTPFELRLGDLDEDGFRLDFLNAQRLACALAFSFAQGSPT